jgi:hypothetical protein
MIAARGNHSMRIIPIALAGSAFAVSLATAALAQTAPAPTNPNTKVYAYKKTNPQSGNTGTAASSGGIPQANRAEIADPPPFGSQKWWEEKARNSQGTGGD